MHPGLRRQHGRRKRRSGPGATTTTDICLFSASGLDTSMAYTVTEIGDVTVIAIWSAVMYPYAPAPGTFNGARPSSQKPNAPLGDDDCTGLRILYPDPTDAVNIGVISGRILPANPLSLPLSPPGVTGIFGAHVVAVDQTSGAVIAGTIAGWSCTAPGPAQFDGSYELDRLPLGHSYTRVRRPPLNGVVSPAQITPAIATLCRNPTTDPGWPPLQGCAAPTANVSFTTRSP